MSEIHYGVGSYVADALDPAEAEEFAAHLAACPTCRREVRELSETAGELGHLAATAPPPALRAGILGAIREVRPLPPEAEPATEVAAGTEVAAAPPDLERAPEPVVPVIDELAVRRERRARRWLAAVAAAAVVVALALGGWAYGLSQQRSDQVAAARAQDQLLSAPDAKIVVTALRDGGRASFVVSKAQNRALFLGTDLPNPGPDRDYQLWRVYSATDIRPAGLVPSGGRQEHFVEGDVADATALAVSLEPEGGSETPTPNQILAEPVPI